MPPISLWLFTMHFQPCSPECLTHLSNCPLDSWVGISATSHTQHADWKLGPHSTLTPIPLPCWLFIPLFSQVLRPRAWEQVFLAPFLGPDLISNHSCPCSSGPPPLASLPSLFLSEGLCTCFVICTEQSSPKYLHAHPFQRPPLYSQQHRHHSLPLTQLYVLHSIIITCLFVYLFTAFACLSPSWAP